MTQFRICSPAGDVVVPELAVINGWWRADAIGAVGWGRNERQAVQDLLGAPPFESGVSEIIADGETPRAELLQRLSDDAKWRNDWRLYPPTRNQIAAHYDAEKMSVWEYRVNPRAPVARVLAVIMSATVRFRVIGAEVYEISAAHGGQWRPSTLDGSPIAWPDVL